MAMIIIILYLFISHGLFGYFSGLYFACYNEESTERKDFARFIQLFRTVIKEMNVRFKWFIFFLTYRG
jgi:hypothetical protein